MASSNNNKRYKLKGGIYDTEDLTNKLIVHKKILSIKIIPIL